MRCWLGLLLLLARVAEAALSTDPFVYDPDFNGGYVVEDRFASVTNNTNILGMRAAVSAAKDPSSDVIASGLVPPEYAGSPPANFGSTRYSAKGQRIPWGAPTSYAFFDNRYLDYPNASVIYISAVADVKVFEGYLFALVDIGEIGSNRDVQILSFTDGGPSTNGGMFINNTPAFQTGLDETGAALLPYCYQYYPVGLQCRLIAIAEYTTGAGRHVITMKRFFLNLNDGSLTVDNSFGISNNGAMDQAAPNALCDAGTACSWHVHTAKALRADTDSPTIYLAGTADASATESDALVVAVNGHDGSLSTNFGGGTGYAVNYQQYSSFGVGIAASSSGDETADVVYLAAGTSDGCGQKGIVTKLRAHVLGAGGAKTLPDYSWGNGGTRDVGGNPGSCAHVYTNVTDMILDGDNLDPDRLVLVGFENITTYPDPLFSVIRASDGALTLFSRGGFPALHPDNTPWGGAAFQSVVARGYGRYIVTGYLYDAAASYATLFGTASFRSDRIFGDGFD